jgi:hypothetical protein
MEHRMEGCIRDKLRSPGFDALEWRGKSTTWMKSIAHMTYIVVEGCHKWVETIGFEGICG